MRVFASSFVLGALVPTYATEAIVCGDAKTDVACVELGQTCVWLGNFAGGECMVREGTNASVYGWSWDGRPVAEADGTKKTMGDPGKVVHHSDFTNHKWVDSVEYGEFQTYIKSDDDGRPTAIGISLPTDLNAVFDKDSTLDPGGRFSLPKKGHHCARAIPFNHVMLNYATNGHPGGYAVPDLLKAFQTDRFAVGAMLRTSTYYQRHFDVDFHLDTAAESNTITCSNAVFPNCKPTEEEKAKFENTPTPEYLPAGQMLDPIANVPFKGAQWHPIMGTSADVMRTQYSPVTGTFDGRVVWFEAMVALTSLEEISMDEEKVYDYEMPAKVAKTGYYPTKLRLRKTLHHGLAADAQRVYQVELSDMVFRLGDNAYKGKKKKVKAAFTEDKLCPKIDCDDAKGKFAQEFCNTCGTAGVRALGKRVKGDKKKMSTYTSCDCANLCKTTAAEGFKFFQKKAGKRGKCTCLKNIKTAKKYDPKYISAVFAEEEE